MPLDRSDVPRDFVIDAVASGPGAVAIVHGDSFKIAFVNKQFHDLFGYDDEEIKVADFSFAQLLDNVQIKRLRSHLRYVTISPEAKTRYTVYNIKAKGGDRSFVYLYASPVDAADETCANYFHLLLLPDLSQWQLPFTSFDTRELFMEQFNKEGFGTFEWMIDADQVYWSDGIYSIYEADRDIPYQDFDAIQKYIHPGDSQMVTSVMQDAIANGTDIDVEYRIVTARQTVKVIHALGRIKKDATGRTFKLIGSIRDVTDQRKIELDLERKIEELNRSNRELEEFAYVASHDLQEPLRKITTFSDRLKERYAGELTGDGLMYLERMMVSAENMRALINNLLEFSRVARSTQPFSIVNLNFILRQVQTDLDLVIEETGTIINAVELPTLEASLTQMKQLFTNIINNAIKFHKEGVRPIINITSVPLAGAEKLKHGLSPGANYFKISLTDNGIGFDDAYAVRIFQIFQRLHGKSEYPGSGIGLAICKKILEHHHGVIYAENIPEQGSRFVVVLPEKQFTS